MTTGGNTTGSECSLCSLHVHDFRSRPGALSQVTMAAGKGYAHDTHRHIYLVQRVSGGAEAGASIVSPETLPRASSDDGAPGLIPRTHN